MNESRQFMQPYTAPTRTPRLVLRLLASDREFLDGAWWPYGANYMAELHDLVSALAPRLGPVRGIAFHWNPHSLRQHDANLPDGLVLEAAEEGQPDDVMRVRGVDGTVLSLRFIAWGAPPEHADSLMRDTPVKPH